MVFSWKDSHFIIVSPRMLFRKKFQKAEKSSSVFFNLKNMVCLKSWGLFLTFCWHNFSLWRLIIDCFVKKRFCFSLNYWRDILSVVNIASNMSSFKVSHKSRNKTLTGGQQLDWHEHCQGSHCPRHPQHPCHHHSSHLSSSSSSPCRSPPCWDPWWGSPVLHLAEHQSVGWTL